MEDEELYLPAFTVRRGGIRWPGYPVNEPDGEERNGMDYALEMLQEQRDSASKQKAAEIVASVKTLHIGEISPGTKVTFTKKFSGDKAYTYLALKVDDEKAGQLWFVTGRERGLTNEKFEELLAEKLGFENFQQLFVGSAIKGWGADVAPTGSTSNEPEPIKGTTSAPKFDLGPIKDLSEASGEEIPE
jgi:hypothetical protein